MTEEGVLLTLLIEPDMMPNYEQLATNFADR
jgi:hypothetical protein